MAQAIHENLRELTGQLNRYREEYYNQNAPSVSDEVYDRLFDELTELEITLGIRMANSPTQIVGYPVVGKLDKTTHAIPLLSLEKTKNVEELCAFMGDQQIMLMLKLDGLTVKLTYEAGQLTQAATRGDGEEGEIITHNVRAISGIPFQIPYQDRLVVTGEAYIRSSDFETLRTSLVDSSGKPYKNGRNLAAGSIRLLDASACKERRVTFMPFGILEGFEDTAKSKKLYRLGELGFHVCKYMVSNRRLTQKELEDGIQMLKEFANTNDIPIDGVVMTYNDIAYSQSCGRTGHHYKDGKAFKFEDDLFESRLRYIEWTPTRSGEIAPVAIFDPVEIDGCEVSRASLHNLTFIEELGLVPGCRLLVSKRNMIIPHVEENLDRGLFPFICDFGKVPSKFQEQWLDYIRVCATHCSNGACDGDDQHKNEQDANPCTFCVKKKARSMGLLQENVYPVGCPCCGHPTRVHTTRAMVAGVERITKTLFCDNPTCEMQRLRQFVHFVSKKAMDIEGLSEATLEKLIGCGWLHDFMDIYQLDTHQAEIVQMEGFGEKSWQRLWDAIQKSRSTTFERYLIAMDIPMIGNTASKALCRQFGGSLNAFEDAVNHRYDFTQLPDFGETLNDNIRRWFEEEENRYLWEELQKMINIEKLNVNVAVERQDNPFTGLTIVVTGKVEPYTRDGINAKIESLGAHAGSSVSKNTNYLICGENAGSKLSRARELNVSVLTPAEFFRMAGE